MAELLPQEYEMVDVGGLVPHPENVNVGAVDAIGESVESSGFYGACVVQRSTRRILVGNHRWRVAVDKGLPSVPVLWVDVDDDRARRIMLSDNRAARLGADDPAGLARLLDDMAATPLGLDGTGYDSAYLDELLIQVRAHERHPPADVDPDEIPEPPVEPVTKLGDLWLLGGHTVCPDCGHHNPLGA